MSESPPAIDVSQPQDGGVMKVIKTAGVGEERPMSGSKVTVHYTGKLLDGTIFDSSHNHGSKFTFNLGKGEVIKAWDWGVASMWKGEICELTCKPQYAYGERGSPPKIPPNATLIFEVELFEWEGEDLTDEKGVIREILEEGSDYASPNEGAEVEVSVVGKYLGKVFDDRTVKYNVGEGDEQLPPAIDLTVKKMKLNERCRIKVAPKYGFGTAGSDALGVPPSAHLTYELRLMSFERVKEAWECSDEERMEQAEIAKKKGTDFVKEQNYKRAIVQYKKIAELLSHHDVKEDGSDEDRETIGKWNKLKLAGYLNVALCQNKEKLYLDAVHSCEEALKLDATSEKAIYRLAEGLFGLKEYHKAKVQFNKVLGVNPSNKSARQFIPRCDAEIRKIKEKESKTFRGMFDKFAQEDEKLEIQRKVHQQQEKARMKAAKKSAGKSDKPDEAGDVPVPEPNGGDVPVSEPNGGDVPVPEPNGGNVPVSEPNGGDVPMAEQA